MTTISNQVERVVFNDAQANLKKLGLEISTKSARHYEISDPKTLNSLPCDLEMLLAVAKERYIINDIVRLVNMDYK